jgi:hypothetical protein
MLNGKGDERARGDVSPRKPQRSGGVYKARDGGTAKRTAKRAGSGPRGSRKLKGNRRGNVAAVAPVADPGLMRSDLGDTMALARDGDLLRNGDVAQAGSGMDRHGRQGLSKMTWNQVTSWAGLTFALAFVIFAAITPH